MINVTHKCIIQSTVAIPYIHLQNPNSQFFIIRRSVSPVAKADSTLWKVSVVLDNIMGDLCARLKQTGYSYHPCVFDKSSDAAIRLLLYGTIIIFLDENLDNI